jgi:hypothetical protein
MAHPLAKEMRAVLYDRRDRIEQTMARSSREAEPLARGVSQRGEAFLPNGPDVAAIRAPKVPIPIGSGSRERQHASITDSALGARQTIDTERVGCHDGQPFVACVKAARRAPRRSRAGSSQMAIADCTPGDTKDPLGTSGTGVKAESERATR